MAGGAAVGTGGKRGGLPQTAAMLNLLTDMAFNLLIFFVVLADPTVEKGRPQQIPAANEKGAESQAKTFDLVLQHPDKSRETVLLNGERVAADRLTEKLKPQLDGKTRPDDKVVVVQSEKDVPYHWWIRVTGAVEKAGGSVALQVSEEKEVRVK